MALVSAITLASTYIQELQNLHPMATHHTNQHMVMHIYDFLQLFGPVHSWCFPFERLIRQLQRMLSNHKFGEMESTMLNMFIKAGKLKCWLARPDCPAVIKECKILFDKAYAPKVLDYNDINDGNDNVFTDTLYVDHRPAPRTVPNDLHPLMQNKFTSP
ncbi:hypothetical protein PILCRDRAFT_17572 [Piloderma croceum F 1598]|uniref:DUF4218 domain-containing protein n=1 Tax=Piloderma croceum (strain F 1598) TaxID=765440 RepID=A0A0C3AAZ2_PILCF|nr:hypothetical protein PILCRDRAFT_17572 [Piloderma croceum F 1598]